MQSSTIQCVVISLNVDLDGSSRRKLMLRLRITSLRNLPLARSYIIAESGCYDEQAPCPVVFAKHVYDASSYRRPTNLGALCTNGNELDAFSSTMASQLFNNTAGLPTRPHMSSLLLPDLSKEPGTYIVLGRMSGEVCWHPYQRFPRATQIKATTVEQQMYSLVGAGSVVIDSRPAWE
jgi:hypothetical protein